MDLSVEDRKAEVLRLLRIAGGSVVGAAGRAGITRAAFNAQLRKLGLTKEPCRIADRLARRFRLTDDVRLSMRHNR